MKQLYTTLALLVVVAGVGGWIYFNERGPVSQTGNAVLLRILPENVQALVIEPASQQRLEITRNKDGWQVHRVGTKSVSVPADSDIVDALLDATQLLESPAVVEANDESKLAEFGLERPSSTLIINDAKIEFGRKPSFDATAIYARVTSSGKPQITLLPVNIAELVDRPFSDWRDKAALRVKAEDTTQLKVNTPAIKASFERIFKGRDGEPDQWLMKTPVEDRADAGTIRVLFDQLAQTKTPQFLEDNPQNLAKWGLDKPMADLEVTTAGVKNSLRIGKVVPGGRAAQNSISHVVFVVPETVLDLLSRPHRNWRDKQILRYSTQDVQSMKVTARGKAALLRYDGKSWGLSVGDKSANTAGVPQAAVDILVGLQGLMAQDFINQLKDLKTYGLDKPALQVELQSSDWNAPKIIQLGSAGGKVYARVAETGDYKATVYILPSTSLESFNLALDALVGKS